MLNNISSEKLDKYTRVNCGYYAQQYEYIKEYNKRLTLNWSALIFAPIWFIYRKMYLIGLILLFLPIIAIPPFWYIRLIVCLIAITIVLLGNYIYIKKYEKIAKDNIESNIIKKGGVNLVASIMAAIVVTVVWFYALTTIIVFTMMMTIIK